MTWTDAPYVLCDRCERESMVADDTTLAAGVEIPCPHCGATMRVAEVKALVQVRCELSRLPPGSSFEDEDTPVQVPQTCPNCLADGVIYHWRDGRARCPRCPADYP